jgi:hypothetical protein
VVVLEDVTIVIHEIIVPSFDIGPSGTRLNKENVDKFIESILEAFWKVYWESKYDAIINGESYLKVKYDKNNRSID